MLPKRNRANKKTIDRIFKDGKFIRSGPLSFKYLINKGLNSTQMSFIVPKNTIRKATDRNLLKRRGYVVLKKHIGQFPIGLMGVFIFNKTISMSEIENEIKKNIHKIN
jgi:ribonuclease P protein component